MVDKCNLERIADNNFIYQIADGEINSECKVSGESRGLGLKYLYIRCKMWKFLITTSTFGFINIF